MPSAASSEPAPAQLFVITAAVDSNSTNWLRETLRLYRHYDHKLPDDRTLDLVALEACADARCQLAGEP
jgi:hypothetical protein